MIYFVCRHIDMFQVDLDDRDLIRHSNLEEVCKWLDTHFIFGTDTETQGFMDHKNKVIMLQIGDDQTQFVIDTRGLDISCLKKYYASSEWLKIFHNAKFDVSFLQFTFQFTCEGIYDTFLAECCITNGIEGRSLSLAALTSKYCNGAILDKESRGKFVGMADKPFTHSAIIYGARDVEYLLCIMEKQQEEILKWGLSDVVDLECRAVLALADIEYNGMLLDATKWMVLADKAIHRITEVEKELDELVMQEPKLTKFRKKYVQVDMFGTGNTKLSVVKWTSPLQVAEVLKALGIEFESTSEKEITKFQNTYPLVKKFIDYKHEQKLATTYGPDFLGYINKTTGRIHTNFWQILETHRVSSSEPNLQQIPAKKEYLACFTAPKGYKIVGTDFSGQELRIIAEGSQDPLWLAAFNEGRDLHGELAAKLFSISIDSVKDKPEYVYVGKTKVYLRDKSPRDVTKTMNFMLAYGGTKYKLSETLGITIDEADVIIQGYFAIVPKVRAFLERLAAYGVEHGFIRSYKPYSGLRHFHNADMRDRKVRGEIEKASKNTPIQMTGALMCKMAMVSLREKIKEVPYGVQMVLQVHDAIYCYVEEACAEKWSIIQKETMEEAGSIWLKSIPCKSDIIISDFWKK